MTVHPTHRQQKADDPWKLQFSNASSSRMTFCFLVSSCSRQCCGTRGVLILLNLEGVQVIKYHTLGRERPWSQWKLYINTIQHSLKCWASSHPIFSTPLSCLPSRTLLKVSVCTLSLPPLMCCLGVIFLQRWGTNTLVRSHTHTARLS